MFALVESGSIIKYFSGNKGITIGDNQYPKEIFTLWSKAEREAIGIYEVEIDNSKKKDEKWYINTNITYSFENGKVTGSYGDAIAKPYADSIFTAQDEIDGLGIEGEIKTRGLKYNLIQNIKKQVAAELSKTDWYIIRKADAGTAVPSEITTHRAATRTKAAEMETTITNASDTPALEALYIRDEDGVRPLGDLPILES